MDWLGELKNVCVKIPLLQTIKNITIYEKTIREFCIKRPRRKLKDPATIHLVGKLAGLMMGKPLISKYEDPSIQTITIQINQKSISNTLVDLGASINIITKETWE